MRSRIAGLFSKVDRSAWLRFFGAVGGLSLAMLAAVYSTVFRESGDLWATALLASLALIIAGVVAFTTVPYLARRVGVRRFTHSFQYEFTKVGGAFLGLIIVVGIAALNTGNNLLFIVVSAMLSAILVSGLASALVLSGLELDILLPVHVFAKRKMLGRVGLHNTRPFLPAISVSVVPKTPKKKTARKWQRSVWTFPPGRSADQSWLRLTDWVWKAIPEKPEAEGRILAGPVYFPYVSSRTGTTADVELRFDRRGRYVQEGLGLATRFPFSFLTKTLPVPFIREIVVYPPVEQTDEFFEVLPLITGEFQAFVRGRGYDLYRIREYMPEDSARHVDWKATAKTGGLKVREFTREDERKLRIVFDNPAPNRVSGQAYEKSVSLAASLAWHFAGEDAQLSFTAPAYTGTSDVYDFLRHLALIAPQTGESILDKLDITEEYNIIFTARPRGSIPTNFWTSSYFIFMEP